MCLLFYAIYKDIASDYKSGIYTYLESIEWPGQRKTKRNIFKRLILNITYHFILKVKSLMTLRVTVLHSLKLYHLSFTQ